jgi:thiol-disulfide isomerase/thioredoxin
MTRIARLTFAFALFAGLVWTAPAPARTPGPDPDSGDNLLGKPAPEWTFTRWVTPGLSREKLAGKVVLLRWWTTGCHFCEATLPEIESLRKRYEKDGLVTLGVFHPKPPRSVSDGEIRRAAAERGFHGPLAFDRDWETLERYWLDGFPDRNWTSVSFLIDQAGNIVWVHGGGEYHRNQDPKHARCDRQARELEAKLDQLFGREHASETSLAH